jgi:hypothetical protein
MRVLYAKLMQNDAAKPVRQLMEVCRCITDIWCTKKGFTGLGKKRKSFGLRGITLDIVFALFPFLQ